MTADDAGTRRQRRLTDRGVPRSGTQRPAGPRWPGRPRARIRRRRRVVFLALTAAAIVAVAIWALLGSEPARRPLRERSPGPGAVPRAEVLRAAGIKPGTPLARIDTAAVARRVEQITQVQSAQVSRDWPDSVVIVIRERTPVLAVASDGGFALIDKFGVVVSHVASASARDGPARRRPRTLSSLRGNPAVQAAVTVLQPASAADPPPGARGGRGVAGRGHAGPAPRHHGAVGRHRPAGSEGGRAR